MAQMAEFPPSRRFVHRAAYAFVVAERTRLSEPDPVAFLKLAPLPEGFLPRGSARSS